MGLERHFIGWDQPMLVASAQWLIQHADARGLTTPSPMTSEIDLSSLLVVVPGRRAGRTFATILIDAAERAGKLVSLPRIVTPGRAVDAIFAVEPTDASAMQESLAWAMALQNAPASLCQTLIGRDLQNDRDQDPLPLILRYAQILSRTVNTLAGENLHVAEIPAEVAQAPASRRTDALLASFDEGQWHAFDQLLSQVEKLLATSSVPLATLRRLRMVRDRTPLRRPDVLLIGVVEMPGLLRRALTDHCASVTSLIAADPHLAPRFSDLGTLNPAPQWLAAEPIRHDEITIAGSPAEQAEAALAHIATFTSALSASDITIAVPDAEVSAALQGLVNEVTCNVPLRVRSADPVPLTHSGPVALLRATLTFTSRRTLHNLLILIQQPEIARCVTAALPRSARTTWATYLDAYASQVADHHLDSAEDESWPAASTSSRPLLEDILKAVDTLLAPSLALNSDAPIATWTRALRTILARIYSNRRVHRQSPHDRADVAALKRLSSLLDQLSCLPADWNLTSASAPLLLQHYLDLESTPPEPDPHAIELLGWLDALADPSPILIITGLNDHLVPGLPATDPLLPESLRSLLNLSTASQRQVRDGFLLDSVRHSRKTHLICGRRSRAGDSLLPSRLLLQDTATLPQRILALQNRASRLTTLARRAQPDAQDSFPVRPLDSMPLPDAVPESMSVTSFSTFLASPYGFYLRHILKLRDTQCPTPELSRLTFGNLIHEALREWSDGPYRLSADQREIAAALSDGLHRVASRSIAALRRVEVELQIHIARTRLEAFSHWQAEHRQQGWEILHSEWNAPARSAWLQIPGQAPMILTGRIDRIDINRSRGTPQYAILDYKTGDSARKPNNPHSKQVNKGEDVEPYQELLPDGSLAPPPRWTNLQLPLYRHLAASIIPSDAPLTLGLLHLPRDPQNSKLDELHFDDNVLASADAAARWVVRSIRARHFDDPGTSPPREPTSALLAGVGLFSPRAAARKTVHHPEGDQ
ncbi:MAG: PD-(D/E)XK nuclease family protein [Planctomycetes bacterium]|nr:PD-(D/E)XK nuclease family protein [Planctomycetota bacterium]